MRYNTALVAALVCALCIVAARSSSAAELPEPLHTLEHEFVIPFDVEVSTPASAKSVQTQLFVSADQGRTWNLYDTTSETEGGFVFRAPFDGEFWFVARVADRFGHVNLDGALAPELRVVVGTCRVPQKVIAELAASQFPAAVQPRMLNTRTFELDYADSSVVQVGPSTGVGIANAGQVLLWWTGDGGVTWHPYGNDTDGHTPMRVTVDGDGLYGLWLTMIGADGTGDPSPKTGDMPQAWVAVDTIAPNVHLTKAEVTSAATGDMLTVHWDAAGEVFADDAVSLEYASTPAGPWMSLDKFRAGSDCHACALTEVRATPGAGLTYFKLSARDAAGNVSTCVTSDPVLLPVAAGPVSANASIDANATAHVTRWYQVLR